MAKIKKLYLSHPIKNRHWIRKAEEKAEKELGIELVNPFYDAGEREDIEKIDRGEMAVYSGDLDHLDIVTSDLREIDKADGVLTVITSSKTIGTICENTYTKLKGKPVFAIVYDEELRHHPWIRWFSDEKIYKSFREWKKWMKENYSDLHSTKH